MPDDPRRHVPPPTPRSEPRIKVPGGASTQQAIEAERRIAERIRPRTAIPIPTIKGAAARRVALAEARHGLNEPEMAFRDDGPEGVRSIVRSSRIPFRLSRAGPVGTGLERLT